MNARRLPRAAIGGYIKLVRLPLDMAVRVLPGNGDGSGHAAEIALDRAEATVRAIAGAVLNDSVLAEDAERRRTAADERARAMDLHAEAQRKTEEADERLEERREGAERRRR